MLRKNGAERKFFADGSRQFIDLILDLTVLPRASIPGASPIEESHLLGVLGEGLLSPRFRVVSRRKQRRARSQTQCTTSARELIGKK